MVCRTGSRSFRHTPLQALCLLLLIFLAAQAARALRPVPTFDATNLREPADLGMPWLVKAGDDPAYANPDFDDSQWMLFDPHTYLNSAFPHSRPEVVWYRLRVKVSPTDTGLALREKSISRAFEIYVNGERLIASGKVAPYAPYTLSSRIRRRIPDRMIASGTLLIAMRVHISQSEWGSPNPGYFASNLALGQQNSLYKDDWLAIIGENAIFLLSRSFVIGLGFVSLVLYVTQRRQPEYLWIFAAGVEALAESPVPAIAMFHDIPAIWELPGDLVRSTVPFILVSMYFAFLHQRMGWRWRALLALTGVLLSLGSMQGLFFAEPPVLQLAGVLPMAILFSVVIPIVLAIHLFRGNREAGILLIPLMLFSLYIYAEVALGTLFQIPGWRSFALRGLNLIDRFPAGPFVVSLSDVAGFLSTLTLAIIILLRFSTMSRRQALLDGELAAAHEVQKVLVPEHRSTIPGFIIDSVYEPAQQVGGDFFQILPVGEGGMVIVVGDVAGKGLPAAMLVSVLVGAICGLSEYTQDPAELLAGLNERLVGRSGDGFSTALAAHIWADGCVRIANAGHLSPYLDGKELELPGALPLGVVAGVRYQTSQFQMDPGSRLTFYSDGVIEAQNQKGELLGFERGLKLSTQPAAAIVEAAIKFGQQDDITVVAIRRAEAIAHAA